MIDAAVVITVSLLAHTKNYYIVGLVPLFPTFALIAHYLVGSERTHTELKTTLLFSLCGMIPLFVCLIAAYALIELMPLKWALILASALWFLPAAVLLTFWTKLQVTKA